jgi:hypothetical protein
MTSDQIEAERVAFEAWYLRKYRRVPRRDGDGYWHGSTTYSWIGYLARAELIHAERQTAEETIERQESQRVRMAEKHERGE